MFKCVILGQYFLIFSSSNPPMNFSVLNKQSNIISFKEIFFEWYKVLFLVLEN